MNTELIKKLAKKKFPKNTMEHLASELGVSKSSISHYFNGRAKPSTERLHKLIEILDTDYNSIFSKED